MSPRTLRFGNDRIWWECSKYVTLSEYMDDSVAATERSGFDCLAQSSYNIRRSLTTNANDLSSYYNYVMDYTRCQLSHPDEDKLVAFSAIARRCASWFSPDDRYCAGIFESTMPWSLLWTANYVIRPRPDKYRAPS